VTISLALDPACSFATIDERLREIGFDRDAAIRPATPDILPGEPELAAWTRHGRERLTYTFNPVVSLRVLALSGLDANAATTVSRSLPALDQERIAIMLGAADPREQLRGVLAARAIGAQALAPAIATLSLNTHPSVRTAAEAALEALAFGEGATSKQQAIAIMQVLAAQAIPVVAALIGPEGGAALSALRPRPDDYARVFVGAIAAPMRSAFEEVWQTPPEIETLRAGEMRLEVNASPAGMLATDNELSRHFPGGYRALAPMLRPDRIWFTWRYVSPDGEIRVRYDGLVRLDDRWAWFPRPYRIAAALSDPRGRRSGGNQ
jgi:hypothetical protein